MRLEQAFAQLEIPITQNVPAIRKAYARKAAQCHPEENPQGWSILHQAYTTALNFATGGRKKSVPQSYLHYHNPYPIQWQESGRVSECDALFAHMETEPEVCTQEQKDAFFWQLQEFKKHFFPIPLSKWMALFSSPDYLACRKDERNIRILLDFLDEGKLTCDTFPPVCQQLWDLQGYLLGEECLALGEEVKKCAMAQVKRYGSLLNQQKQTPVKRHLTRFRWWWKATSNNLKLLILLPLITFTVVAVILLLIALEQIWLLWFLCLISIGALPKGQKRN